MSTNDLEGAGSVLRRKEVKKDRQGKMLSKDVVSPEV